MKKFFSFLLVLVSVVVLSACGRREYAPVTVLTIDDVKAADHIEITFKTGFGSAIETVMEELIEEFMDEYPNITVKASYGVGYDQLRDSIRYDIQSFDSPTMAVGYPDHFAEYLIGSNLIPLDEYIHSKYEGVGFSKEEWEDFIEDYLIENTQFDTQGTYFGLPFNKSTEVLIYNKKFFNAFELEPPKTWDELEVLAKEILRIVTSGEADELYDGLKMSEHIKTNKFVPISWDSNANLFITATRQWGGTYTKRIDNENGEPAFNSPETKAALEYLNKLAQHKVDGKLTPLFTVPEFWEEKYASGPFQNLQTMVTVGSSAGVYHNIGGKVDEIGVAPIPYKDETHKYVIQQGTNVAIFADTTDLERMAAWLLIKHFLEPENHARFNMATSYFPVRKSVYDLPEYQEFLVNPPMDLKANSLAANVGTSYRDLGFTYFVDGAWSGSARVRDAVGLIPAQVFTTGKSIESAITDAYKNLGYKVQK